MFSRKREAEKSSSAPRTAAPERSAAAETDLELPRRSEPVRPAERGVPVPPEGKRLIVGRGISLSGEITACDRLVVEGSVQVTLNQTRAIEITETGRFMNGKAEVEEAEISGVYEGELTVRNRLLIRSTGRVTGKIRYGEIEIERGGQISGQVEVLDASRAHKQTPAAAGAKPAAEGSAQEAQAKKAS